MLNQNQRRWNTMHRKWPLLVLTVVLLTAAVPVLPVPVVSFKNPVLVVPANSRSYGHSLTEWTEAYWRWYVTVGGTATEPYQPGRAPLVFMPIPQGDYLGGSFTADDPGYLQGSIEVTISPRTAFFLGCFSWIPERYNTGQADDPAIPNDQIQSVAIHPSGTGFPEVTLDGQPILENFWAYYVGPNAFDPIVEYPVPSSYGSIAAIRFQGVGFVAHLLPPGTHTLHLFERLRITNEDVPDYEFPLDLGVIYDQTWIIHVQ